MDIHLDPFLDFIRTSPKIWFYIRELWKETYGCSENVVDFPPKFNADFDSGYVKLDRVCYRVRKKRLKHHVKRHT